MPKSKLANLIKNTYYNASAFGINTAVALAIIPLLVAAYGMEGYGLVILARQLLPVGFVVLLDFGLPEVTTRYISSALARGQRGVANGRFTASLIISLLVGLVSMLLMLAAADFVIHDLLAITESHSGMFRTVLMVSAVSLLFQFPGAVLRGAIEGVERFDIVRLMEVLSNLLFATTVLAIIHLGGGVGDVAIAYALIGNARAIFYALFVVARKPGGLTFSRIMLWPDVRPMIEHAWSFFQSKLLTALFNHGPAIVIAVVSGVAAVGAYDILMRIPRLLKTMTGLFSNALIPYAARKDALGDMDASRKVINIGGGIVMSLVLPLAICVALFSEDVVRIWIGRGHDYLAPWLAVAMIWPALLSIVSIGSSIVVVRHNGVRSMNFITLANLIVFYGVSVLFLPSVGGQAFVAGLTISALTTVPMQYFLIVKEYGLCPKIQFCLLLRLALTGVALAGSHRILASHVTIESGLSLAVAMGMWLSIYYAIVYFFIMQEENREVIRTVFGRFSRS